MGTARKDLTGTGKRSRARPLSLAWLRASATRSGSRNGRKMGGFRWPSETSHKLWASSAVRPETRTSSWRVSKKHWSALVGAASTRPWRRISIARYDGRSFGVARQSLALRRRSGYDRLRAIAEYEYTRRPDTFLIPVPGVWVARPLPIPLQRELPAKSSQIGTPWPGRTFVFFPGRRAYMHLTHVGIL